jgi:hypothetical protein
MFSDLMKKARELWDSMTPEQQRAQVAAQSRSVVIAEAGIGSDRQEREYADALSRGDSAEIARLTRESEQRMVNAAEMLGALPAGTRLDDPALPTGNYTIQSLNSTMMMAASGLGLDSNVTVPIDNLDKEVSGVQFVYPGGIVPISEPVRMIYTNYKGETEMRTFIPVGVGWGSNEWHKTPQWMIVGYDLVKAEFRTFAMADAIFDFARVATMEKCLKEIDDAMRNEKDTSKLWSKVRGALVHFTESQRR